MKPQRVPRRLTAGAAIASLALILSATACDRQPATKPPPPPPAAYYLAIVGERGAEHPIGLRLEELRPLQQYIQRHTTDIIETDGPVDDSLGVIGMIEQGMATVPPGAIIRREGSARFTMSIRRDDGATLWLEQDGNELRAETVKCVLRLRMDTDLNWVELRKHIGTYRESRPASAEND